MAKKTVKSAKKSTVKLAGNNQPRRTRTTQVDIVVCTSFKQLSEVSGIHAATIGNRYHAAKAANPRKPVAYADLVHTKGLRKQ